MKVNKQQKPYIKMMRLHPDVQLPVTNFIHVVYVSFFLGKFDKNNASQYVFV